MGEKINKTNPVGRLAVRVTGRGGPGLLGRAPGTTRYVSVVALRFEANRMAILWSADGGSLFAYKTRDTPARVFNVDIATGRRELWKTIAPADRSGLVAIDNIVMTPDTRSYAYSYQRILASLEVVEGLR